MELAEELETGLPLSLRALANSLEIRKPTPWLLPPRVRARCCHYIALRRSLPCIRGASGGCDSCYGQVEHRLADREAERSKTSKLDKHFLSKSQPLHQGLLFFPKLYTESSRSWNMPFSTKRMWQRVWLGRVCILWPSCRHTRLTC